MPVDLDDPKMEGYAPLQDFIDQDQDQSSRRIRDMPFGKRKEEIQLSVSSLNFGEVGQDYTSASQVIVITNVGYAQVNIYGTTLEGEFVLKSQVPQILLAGETASVQVAFKPTSLGSKTGSIYFDTGNAAGDELVAFLGNGILSAPEVPPEELKGFIREVVAEIPNISTIAGISNDISIVSGIAADISVVAANAELVIGIAVDVSKVASIDDDVTTAAGIADQVTTVAGIAGAVAIVAALHDDIAVVIANSVNINTVAGIEAEIMAVPAQVQAAEDARDLAVSAAASINLPTFQPSDAGKQLAIKADGLGYALVDLWSTFPISTKFDIEDHVPGVPIPPKDQAYRYVLLTAGESGAGKYNEGILTNEITTGSGATLVVTAVVNLEDSPYHGRTIHLINTERRVLRAGLPGTVENDQMQEIIGQIEVARTNMTGASGALSGSTNATGSGVSSGTGSHATLKFSSAGSTGARTGTETRGKNLGVNFYMRIK